MVDIVGCDLHVRKLEICSMSKAETRKGFLLCSHSCNIPASSVDGEILKTAIFGTCTVIIEDILAGTYKFIFCSGSFYGRIVSDMDGPVDLIFAFRKYDSLLNVVVKDIT